MKGFINFLKINIIPQSIFFRNNKKFEDLYDYIDQMDFQPDSLLNLGCGPSPAVFQDLYHVNNIITSNTFSYYFCKSGLYAKNYGFKGVFEVVKEFWKGHQLMPLLKK